MAGAVGSLSWSVNIQEQTGDGTSAKRVWDIFLKNFQRHTLFNKLKVPCKFYTLTEKPGEKDLIFISTFQ